MTERQARVGRPPSMAAPREAILASAAQLFAKHGFEGTSLQQVAAATGITKAAIYHYFQTKQVMYEAIVVDLLTRLDAHVRASVDATDHAGRLRQVLIGHAEFFEANYTEFVTLLHGVSGLSRVISDTEASVRDRYESFVREVVASGIAAGAFTGGEVNVIARSCLSLLNWMSRWYRPGGPRTAREFAEDYFDLVYLGLKPR